MLSLSMGLSSKGKVLSPCLALFPLLEHLLCFLGFRVDRVIHHPAILQHMSTSAKLLDSREQYGHPSLPLPSSTVP